MTKRLLQFFNGRHAKQHKRKSGISQKIAMIFMIILLVAAANMVVVQAMLQAINGVAETINVAGKLRMLSQKIAFETLKVLGEKDRPTDKVNAAIDDFQTALGALVYGGHAFGMEVKKVSPQHQLRLDATRTDWINYRSHVEAAIAGAERLAIWPTAIGQITEDSARLLLSAEALVSSLTKEAHQAQQGALVKMYVLLLLDVSVLAIVFLAVRKQIVYPLRELGRQSLALAEGNYHARINYRSHDEIGQLADAFNQSAQHIGNLIVHIEKDRRNIQQAESMFRGLAENSVVGVYIVQDNLFRFANPKMAEMFSYGANELTSSVNVFDLVVDDDRHLVEENIQRRLKDNIDEVHFELRALRKDGSTFDVEVFGSRMELDGKLATIGIMLDVTERKRIDRALRILIASNQALVRATEESALLTEICRIVQQLSGYPFVWVGYADESAAKRVLPVALAEASGGTLLSFINHETWDATEHGKRVTGNAIRTGRTSVVQNLQSNELYAPWRYFIDRYAIVSALSLPLKTGTKIIGALTIYSQEGATFTPDEVKIVEELTENLAYGITALRADAARQRYARQLEHNANHDVLTGLGNRSLLSERLKQAIAAAQRSGQMLAVLLLDLDHFKVVNDSLGHAAGDALLQVVADCLRASVRQMDTVARLGGDEFVIVMPDVTAEENVRIVAHKILEVLSQSFFIAGQELHIGVSIGISLYPQDGENEKILLKNVDLAMYRAKQNGRANFNFYTEEMNVLNREKNALQSELHFALNRGELLLHYQPKIDVLTRKIVGVEALIRWQHPERGLILPEKFISLAEETGLIIPIGTWVIQTACLQNKAWQDAGLPPVSVAVNLSAWQLHRRDLVGLVKQILSDTELHPEYLELELTESVIIQEANEVVPTLLGLKALGVLLSLDDFGTGYSSLNYLRRYPFDNLKIDRLFVEGITSSEHDTAIVQAVIALAHSLNLRVVAEGVEIKAELDFLQEHDCDEIQGYYFSKPLPPDELKRLLEARKC